MDWKGSVERLKNYGQKKVFRKRIKAGESKADRAIRTIAHELPHLGRVNAGASGTFSSEPLTETDSYASVNSCPSVDTDSLIKRYGSDNTLTDIDHTSDIKSVHDESESCADVEEYCGNKRVLKPKPRIGLQSLAEQIRNKSVRAGFEFNLMVLGESGLGKTTLIESLFDLPARTTVDEVCVNNEGVDLHQRRYELFEGDVYLKLSIIESVGLGDAMDRNGCAQGIGAFLDKQYIDYLVEENKIIRPVKSAIQDNRIHLCIYLIPPTGLTQLDVECLLAVNGKVNLLPVIARADSFTKRELEKMKDDIRQQLRLNHIKCVEFESELMVRGHTNEVFNSSIPLAVIASLTGRSKNGKFKRGREVVTCSNRGQRIEFIDISENEFSDFPLLQSAIIKHNTDFLIQTTDQVHYRRFRTDNLERLIDFMGMPDHDNEYHNLNRPKLIIALAHEIKNHRNNSFQCSDHSGSKAHRGLKQVRDKINAVRAEKDLIEQQFHEMNLIKSRSLPFGGKKTTPTRMSTLTRKLGFSHSGEKSMV